MTIKSCAYNAYIDTQKIKGFYCENERINKFFHKEAEELEKCGAGNTVIYYEDSTGEIFGFYTLSLRPLNITELKNYDRFNKKFLSDFANSFEIEEFPALEIMRSGVSYDHRLKRIGASIIYDIYKQVIELQIYYNLPINVIFIEALYEVTEFYEKLGFEFIKYSDEEHRLEKYPMLINTKKIIDIVYPKSK